MRNQGHRINFISMTQTTMDKVLDEYSFLPYANCGFAGHHIMNCEIKVQANTLGDYLLDCEYIIMVFTLT